MVEDSNIKVSILNDDKLKIIDKPGQGQFGPGAESEPELAYSQRI